VVKSLPLSALLANPSWQCSGNLTPVHRTIFANHCHEGVVLFLRPGALDHGGIENFLPSVQALNICATLEERRYTFPVFCLKIIFHIKKNIVAGDTYPVLVHKLAELLVLHRDILRKR